MEKQDDIITVTRKPNRFDAKWVRRSVFEEANAQYIRDMDTMCAKNHALRKELKGLAMQLDAAEGSLKFARMETKIAHEGGYQSGFARGLFVGLAISAAGWAALFAVL